MSPIELPCTPSPELRPHEVRVRNKELIRGWLSQREGVVVYVPYPPKTQVFPVTLAPVLGVQDAGVTMPGDRYIYQNGQKVKLASGSIAVMAARVMKDEDTTLVATDVVIPEMEYPGDPDAIEKTLANAFTWISDT